jgi:hypothetical protein
LDTTGQVPRNITLPLLVAAADVRGSRDRLRVLSLAKTLRGSNIYPCFSTINDLLENIWAAQENGHPLLLFDVFDRHVQTNILP